MPRSGVQLYDLQLDPREWFDRSISLSALADSLRHELRARLYGAVPVLVLRAGDDPVRLALDSTSALDGPPDRSLKNLELQAGETLRVRLSEGAASVQLGSMIAVEIGGHPVVIEELIVHSDEWMAALAEPDQGSGFTIWIE